MGETLTTPAAWVEPLGAFGSWLRAADRPESTRKMRSYQLRRFAITTGLMPFEASLDDLVDYLGSHGWSANTKRAARSALRGFFTWAHSTGRMGANPALLLPTVTAPLGRPRPAPEEAVELGKNAIQLRTRTMVSLAAHVGLRCAEVAQVHSDDLRRDMVDWSLLVHGKGNKTRLVPIGHQLAGIIAEADGYLFPGQVDGHLSAAYVSKLVSRALPEGVTAHMLRHRFASKAYEPDRDIRAVQELLGHASVATTQIYTAVPDGALRRASAAAA